MKLAIIGSRAYTNLSRVQQVTEKYISQYPNVIIVSGGCPKGGDALGKQVALSLGLTYQEFPPIHNRHNQYCVLPKEHYNKTYHVSNFFSRNSDIAEYCDHLAAFVIKGVKANGTMHTVEKARLLGKPVFIFEDE